MSLSRIHLGSMENKKGTDLSSHKLLISACAFLKPKRRDLYKKKNVSSDSDNHQ